MLLMCQLSAHLYAEGPPLYCSQFDRKTHTIVPIQHVDVSTVSLSVCRRCTFQMFPFSFIYMKRAYRQMCQLVPMLLISQLSAHLYAEDRPLDWSNFKNWGQILKFQEKLKKRKCPYFLDWSKVKFHFEGPKNFYRFFSDYSFSEVKKTVKTGKNQKSKGTFFSSVFHEI